MKWILSAFRISGMVCYNYCKKGVAGLLDSLKWILRLLGLFFRNSISSIYDSCFQKSRVNIFN
jgi:hypothetical protein